MTFLIFLLDLGLRGLVVVPLGQQLRFLHVWGKPLFALDFLCLATVVFRFQPPPPPRALSTAFCDIDARTSLRLGQKIGVSARVGRLHFCGLCFPCFVQPCYYVVCDTGEGRETLLADQCDSV